METFACLPCCLARLACFLPYLASLGLPCSPALPPRYGVTSTWDESLYTTPLDESRLTAEQRAEARVLLNFCEQKLHVFFGCVLDEAERLARQ